MSILVNLRPPFLYFYFLGEEKDFKQTIRAEKKEVTANQKIIIDNTEDNFYPCAILIPCPSPCGYDEGGLKQGS